MSEEQNFEPPLGFKLTKAQRMLLIRLATCKNFTCKHPEGSGIGLVLKALQNRGVLKVNYVTISVRSKWRSWVMTLEYTEGDLITLEEIKAKHDRRG